jgi:hypothetical protein
LGKWAAFVDVTKIWTFIYFDETGRLHEAVCPQGESGRLFRCVIPTTDEMAVRVPVRSDGDSKRHKPWIGDSSDNQCPDIHHRSRKNENP